VRRWASWDPGIAPSGDGSGIPLRGAPHAKGCHQCCESELSVPTVRVRVRVSMPGKQVVIPPPPLVLLSIGGGGGATPCWRTSISKACSGMKRADRGPLALSIVVRMCSSVRPSHGLRLMMYGPKAAGRRGVPAHSGGPHGSGHPPEGGGPATLRPLAMGRARQWWLRARTRGRGKEVAPAQPSGAPPRRPRAGRWGVTTTTIAALTMHGGGHRA